MIPVRPGQIRFRPKSDRDGRRASAQANALPRVSLAGLAVAELGLSARDDTIAAAGMGSEPCLLFCEVGTGRAVYLNLTVSSYLELREKSTARTSAVGALEQGVAANDGEDRGAPLRDVLAKILAQSGVEPIARAQRLNRDAGTLRTVRHTSGPLDVLGIGAV